MNAISNPRVHVIAHLTGRRVGIRPLIELDLDAVLGAAAEPRTALEVNGHLDRMDISPELVARARAMGALFAANSDAHRPNELANVAHSIGMLQRGWVSRSDVVNCWTFEELMAWIKRGAGAVEASPASGVWVRTKAMSPWVALRGVQVQSLEPPRAGRHRGGSRTLG